MLEMNISVTTAFIGLSHTLCCGLEMGMNPEFRVRVRFSFFIDGIGNMFPRWSSVAD